MMNRSLRVLSKLLFAARCAALVLFAALLSVLLYDPASAQPVDSVAVVPQDTSVAVGDSVQFSATVLDTSGTEMDTTVTWAVDGPTVGSVDTTRLFTASAAGTGFVRARLDTLTGEATVSVVDTAEVDTGSGYVVQVLRAKPNPSPAPPDTITVAEGESYTLGGFPHPLQLLNGGELTIPEGALTENIELLIEIEGFATVENDRVTYPNERIVTGANFTVQIDGERVDGSYTFEEPLSLALPYKRGVIKNMGIAPTEIGMYFYDTESGALDTTGISETVVDTAKNRILADVAHFTPVVLASERTVTSVAGAQAVGALPDRFALKPNYPNPFNPTTTIHYHLPRASQVRLTAYDALGREVRRLDRGRRAAGVHTVRFEASGLPSGLYFYRLRVGSDEFVRTRSMILAK